MADIGMPVLEKPAAVFDRVIDLARTEHCANRLIPRAKPFGDGADIWADVFLIRSKKRPCPAHAAHDLIKDQQHAVFVTDLADAFEIALYRRHRAHSRADDGFGYEGHDLIRAKPQDLVLKLVCHALTEVKCRLIVALLAVFIARADMAHVDQQRCELRAAPFVATYSQCAERIAVVTLTARDDL